MVAHWISIPEVAGSSPVVFVFLQQIFYKSQMALAYNPYMNIELSTDTESEKEDFDQQDAMRDARKKPRKADKGGKQLKSSQAKKYEVLNRIEKTMNKKLQNNDLGAVYDDFEAMNQELSKMQALIDVEGTPVVYLRVLKNLHNKLNEAEPDQKNTKDDSKNVRLLKQTVKKLYVQYEEDIKAADEKGDLYKLESEAEFDENTGEDYTEESEEEEEMDFTKRLTLSKEERRKFWMVKTKDKTEVKVKEKKERKNIQKKPKFIKQFLQEEEEFQAFETTDDNVSNKIKSIYETKAVYKEEEIAKNRRFLNYIYPKIENDNRKVELLLLLINLNLDEAKLSGIMSCELWSQMFSNIKKLSRSLKSNDLQIVNYYMVEKLIYTKNELLNIFHTFIFKLDFETNYGLKLSDPFGDDFVERLHQEAKLIDFCNYIRGFYEELGNEINKTKFLTDISFIELEHIYHMSNDIVINSDIISNLFEDLTIEEKVNKLKNYIIQNTSDETIVLKTRLYCTFNSVLNANKLDGIKTELLEIATHSRMQSDRYLIGLFNRTLCLLGLSYFKAGEFLKVKECLYEIVNSENIEQLLYQYNPKAVKVLDLPDPLAVFPYYMHLNIDEIESSFMISSVLTESHHVIAYLDNYLKAPINNKFQKFLDKYQKNFFVNSADNVNDCIFMIFRQMIKCQIEAAYESGKKIKFLRSSEDCLKSFKEQLKFECFNIYIEQVKDQKSLSLVISDLSNIFEIPETRIQALLTDMICKGFVNCSISSDGKMFKINNVINKFCISEEDYMLLERVKKAYEYNLGAKQIVFEPGKDNTIFELNGFVQRNFDKQQDSFKFATESQNMRKAAV